MKNERRTTEERTTNGVGIDHRCDLKAFRPCFLFFLLPVSSLFFFLAFIFLPYKPSPASSSHTTAHTIWSSTAPLICHPTLLHFQPSFYFIDLRFASPCKFPSTPFFLSRPFSPLAIFYDMLKGLCYQCLFVGVGFLQRQCLFRFSLSQQAKCLIHGSVTLLERRENNSGENKATVCLVFEDC